MMFSKTMLRAMQCAVALLILFCAVGPRAQAANDAVFASRTVPASMAAGSRYTVTVVMRNTGTTTWTAAGKYFLGSQNPENGMTWGVNRVPLLSSVVPGGQVSFTFAVTAPVPGSHNFQWRMVQDGVEWFGPYTPNTVVTVSAPVDGAQLVGVTVPAAMTQGKSYNVAVTMKNTGNTTWAAGSAYRLGSTNPMNTTLWSPNRVNLNNAVAPGAQYTFSFAVVAPAAGSYIMGWGMVQEFVAWFGPTSSSAVTVTAAALAPTIKVSRTPSAMIAGQPYTLSWSSTNAASVSRLCTSSGTGYTVNDAPPLNGTSAGTASSAWVGAPSTCTWKDTGASGTASFTETMVTNAAPTSEVVTYLHTDGLGSPVARTNAAGALVSRTRYEPYGLTAGGVTPTIGFTGHVNDADTGLVYMQQRYYDPVAGRFLSIDPVTTDANTGGSFNRYSYANNNPYKYVDPDGRNPLLRVVYAVSYGAATRLGAARLGVAISSAIFAATHKPPMASGGQGCIYCVPGTHTSTGEKYVGSTDNLHQRKTDKSDGRDRNAAEVIDTYNKADKDERRRKEQQAINDLGGVENLDNRRNEISETKWDEKGVKPPEPSAPEKPKEPEPGKQE